MGLRSLGTSGILTIGPRRRIRRSFSLARESARSPRPSHEPEQVADARRRPTPATPRASGCPRTIGPMATRTSRSVGWPTAAVIRRTWRFRPSRSTRRSQAVGTFLRNRIGTGRSGRSGSSSSSSASTGRGSGRPEDDAPAKGVERRRFRDLLDLGQVGLGMLDAGVGQAMGERPVVGQEEQALAVPVEPAHRVDPGTGTNGLSGSPGPPSSVNWVRTSNGLKTL